MPNQILHLPTLITISLLINFIIGIYLFILYKRKPKDLCFKYWAFSCFSFVIGGFAATGRAFDYPPLLSYFIADVLLIAAPFLIFIGLVKFSRFRFTKRRRRMVKWSSVGILITTLLTHSSPQVVNFFAEFITALLFWICSRLLAKSVFNEPVYTRLLQTIFVLHSAIMLTKIFVDILPQPEVSEISLAQISMFVFLSHILLTTLTALLLPWLAFLKLERKLILKSQRDGLTKLANREHFFASVKRHWANPSHNSAIIMMIDIDHFKAVNDNYGHIAGDKVIKRVASTLAKALRSHDLIGRVGGEEFAVLITNESLKTAEIIAVRLLEQTENTRLSIDGSIIQVTISIGIVEALPNKHTVLESFSAADKALYASKHNGRNMHTVESL